MRQGTIIGPLIIAIGLVVAALSFALVGALLQSAEGTTELRVERLEAEIAELKREVEQTREQVRRAEADTKRVLEDMARMASRAANASVTGSAEPLTMPTDRAVTEDMTEVMRLAKDRFNQGITQPNNRIMLELLGRPRETLDQTCRSVTQPRLAGLLETRTVGPIRVTMIKPALRSLERIMDKLATTEPDIYNAIGTAGSICARLIRGSTRSISNHSWGTAVDIKLENRLDGFADGGTQFGLLVLAEAFNDEGWYWGATYGREDSMHFEVGAETLRAWAAEGWR